MKAYIIGIDSDKNVQKDAVKQLREMGLDAQAWHGVNGKKENINPRNYLSLGALFKSKFVKHRAVDWDFPLGDPRGALGCFLSHKKIWEHMVENNVPVALIGEADIVPKPSLSQRIQDGLQNLEKWDILLLDCTLKNHHLKGTGLENANHGFKKGKQSFLGLHGYLLSKQGAQILLKYAMPIEFQLDSYIPMLVYLDKLRAWFDPTKPVTKRSTKNRKSSTQTDNTDRIGFCHGDRIVATPGYIAFYVAFAILFILAIVFAILYAVKKQ